jgi:hypothetical protein
MRLELFESFKDCSSNCGIITLPYTKTTALVGYTREIYREKAKYIDLLFTNKYSIEEIIDFKILDMDILMKSVEQIKPHTYSLLNITNTDYYSRLNNDKCYIEKYYYTSELVFDQPLPGIKKYQRNINKAKTNLEYKRVYDHSSFFDILKLGNKKAKTIDSTDAMHNQACFLSKYSLVNRVISFALFREQEIVAGIISIIFYDTLYMLINNYKLEYLYFCPNDFLYYLLITVAKSSNIKKINWGETDENDVGLLAFKRKYSNINNINKSFHKLYRIR